MHIRRGLQRISPDVVLVALMLCISGAAAPTAEPPQAATPTLQATMMPTAEITPAPSTAAPTTAEPLTAEPTTAAPTTPAPTAAVVSAVPSDGAAARTEDTRVDGQYPVERYIGVGYFDDAIPIATREQNYGIKFDYQLIFQTIERLDHGIVAGILDSGHIPILNM
jgi:hypothetical protein